MLELSLPIEAGDEKLSGLAGDKEALVKLGHRGTHLDRLLKSVIPLNYFKSRGLCFDVRRTEVPGLVAVSDIDLDLIRPGDFVMFRSGVMEKFAYGSREYMNAPFELDWKLIEALLELKIHFIGLDARGIRLNEEHREADTRCEKAGVFVIENLCNLEKLPDGPFEVYAAWFDLGGSGLPVRVVAEAD